MSATVFSSSLRDRLETRESLAENILREAFQQASIELSDEQRSEILQRIGRPNPEVAAEPGFS